MKKRKAVKRDTEPLSSAVFESVVSDPNLISAQKLFESGWRVWDEPLGRFTALLISPDKITYGVGQNLEDDGICTLKVWPTCQTGVSELPPELCHIGVVQYLLQLSKADNSGNSSVDLEWQNYDY